MHACRSPAIVGHFFPQSPIVTRLAYHLGAENYPLPLAACRFGCPIGSRQDLLFASDKMFLAVDRGVVN